MRRSGCARTTLMVGGPGDDPFVGYSVAFMTLVGTPPNAIAFNTGYVTMKQK